MVFDAWLMVDWSARSTPAPRRESADAIWFCYRRVGLALELVYCRTRQEAEAAIEQRLRSSLRTLAGFDFGFTFAAWVHRKLRLPALDFWDWLDRHIVDSPDSNNRFEIAAELNRRLSGRAFPFWATPRPLPLLSPTKPGGYTEKRPEWREPELYLKQALGVHPQPSFKLYTTGSVGSQILLGLPMLARLRRRFAGETCVWPFEPPERRVVLAEIYPSMFPETEAHSIKDARQVLSTSLRMQNIALEVPSEAKRWRDEGWIAGATLAGYEPPRDSARIRRRGADPD